MPLNFIPFEDLGLETPNRAVVPTITRSESSNSADTSTSNAATDVPPLAPSASELSTNETYNDIISKIQPLVPKTIPHARTYKLLEEARTRARNKRGYCSETYRRDMREAVRATFNGMVPYWYQEDIAEAFHLGLNVSVLAGTGFGKTLPFIMPLLADSTGKSKVIIVSPLNALQSDQVSILFIIFLDNDLTLYWCRPVDSVT